MNEQPVENMNEQPATEQEPVDIWQEVLEGLPELLRSPLEQYARQIIAGFVIIVLGSLLFTGYNTYRFRQESAAATAFGLALSAKDPVALAQGMEKVVKEHAGTHAARHAMLLLAAAQRDAGDMLHASENFKKAADAIDRDSIAGQSALMGSAYVAEARGDNEHALEGYDAAISAGTGFEKIALADKARVLAAMDRKSDALACYEKLLDASPAEKDLDYIRYQIMQMSASGPE